MTLFVAGDPACTETQNGNQRLPFLVLHPLHVGERRVRTSGRTGNYLLRVNFQIRFDFRDLVGNDASR
jgi:hypothetical protein